MTLSHLYILTGGSRGMGLAMARQLLQPGHTLVLIARTVNATLTAPPGCVLEQWPHDLADAAPVAGRLQAWLQAQAADRHASATLINNAGTLAHIAPLHDCGGATEQMTLANALRVGLEAPMLLGAAFLAATREWSAARRLLNISSGLGRHPMASQAAYCAAKAGLDHLTRCVALEEAIQPHGARVCALAPGVIDTDMQGQLRGADEHAFPDRSRFIALQRNEQLISSEEAAHRVLAWLHRPDFGAEVIADVRSSA